MVTDQDKSYIQNARAIDNKRLLLFFTLMLSACFVNAEYKSDYKIYPLGGMLKGVFPSMPTDLGEIGIGKNTTRGFQAVAEDTLLVYSASYTVYEQPWISQDKKGALDGFIKSQVTEYRRLGRSAILSDSSIGMINGFMGAYYTFEYMTTQGKTNVYNVTLVNENRFFTWFVRDMEGYSNPDGQVMFNTYEQYFTPIL
jgi:hypothetical protein